MAETVWEPTPEEAVARAVETQRSRGLLPRQHAPRGIYSQGQRVRPMRPPMTAQAMARESGVYTDQVAGFRGDGSAPLEGTSKALVQCVLIFAAGFGIGYFFAKSKKAA